MAVELPVFTGNMQKKSDTARLFKRNFNGSITLLLLR